MTSFQRNVPISLTENALRPDRGGKLGKPTKVLANFFAVKKLGADTIHHYDVSISPELPPKKIRKLWALIEQFPELPKDAVVFDGRCNAYASEELEFSGSLVRKVQLPDSHPAPAAASDAQSTKNKNEFTVKIKKANTIQLEELHMFLARKGPLTSSCLTACQALNIAVMHKPASELITIGRNVYTDANPTDLGKCLEKRDGIHQSVLAGQENLFLNVNTVATSFVKGGSFVSLIAEHQERPIEGLKSIQPRDVAALNSVFRGCFFTVTHRGGEFKRQFRISEVSTKSADQIKFDQELNNGTKRSVTITQYYASAYGIRLRFPSLPCLGVKGRDNRTLYFPVEVCHIVAGRHFNGRLNEMQTTKMIKSTSVRPDERAKRINGAVATLKYSQNPYMRSFGMEVSSDMTTVPARVLQPPSVVYRNNVKAKVANGGWNWDTSHKMVTGAKIDSWGVVVFDSPSPRFKIRPNLVEGFVRDLVDTLSQNGLNVVLKDPPVVWGQNGNVEASMRNGRDRVMAKCKVEPQFLLVLLPNKCATYSHVKTYCETEGRNIITQCIAASKLSGPRVTASSIKQYCRMVGLKINMKLGGINNIVPPAELPFITDRPTIVFGADVTHPAPGENKPSVVAVVASMDNRCARYFGRLHVQGSRVEVIENLNNIVEDLLREFKRINKVVPQRIMFYRDGVSEGQYEEIRRTEVEAIRQGCRQVDDSKVQPLINFCVVKKRHHARFFPQTPGQADKSGNCIAGTVVDTVITHPTEFNFYLLSHGGLQGTSRPTLYHVLLNESNLSSDAMQELTYRLCHLYGRCPRSVSIVPPVYYAHLLAFRARHYFGGDQSDAGSFYSSTGDSPVFQLSEGIQRSMFWV